MAQKKSNESGQSIVIMAFAIVVLMGVLAIAVDGGRIFTLRRDAQNAADAAALQGARSLCRDEDFVAVAEDVAARGGFAGAGVVKVNNPPVRSDSPTINDDQVEVVITATIQGGLIAPVVYDGEINTRVLAVGDCLRGSLSGSGSAIFAGANGCPTKEVNMSGSTITVIGGIHSNGQVQIGGGGQTNTITGTVSHVGTTNLPNGNTDLNPPDGNPTQVTHTNYPVDLKYADFVKADEPNSNGEDGWAYLLMMNDAPGDYHYYPGEITKNVLQNQGWLDPATDVIDDGVYVTPIGFKFSGAGGTGLTADAVTFVTLKDIDFSGNGTHLRPYFSGLLMLTDGNGDPCASASVIKMSGSTVSWGGIIFAPNGNVSMSFSDNSTFFGSIIAGTVDVSGSSTYIIYDPAYLPPTPDTVELGT